ncbi:hypothetical protein ACIPRD_10035 [Streptomyces sp. NPDC090108]|uniref:hypothetical protein n=1 Tax=Streptomyces sp. NPDC090108 TaxID=3365947 RepID=UPI0037FE87B5
MAFATTATGAGSALQGADASRTVSCGCRLDPVCGTTDAPGPRLGLVSKADVADVPLKAFAGACFRPDLMRGVELTNEALGAVADDIQSRQPVTASSLLAAPVPAACGHKGGRLSGGELPDIPAQHGVMGLAWEETGQPRGDLLTFGDLDGDGTGDAAATLYCTTGGVPWPEITLRWNGHAVAPSGLTATTEHSTADRFLPALRDQDTAAASSLATDGVAAKAAAHRTRRRRTPGRTASGLDQSVDMGMNWVYIHE